MQGLARSYVDKLTGQVRVDVGPNVGGWGSRIFCTEQLEGGKGPCKEDGRCAIEQSM